MTPEPRLVAIDTATRRAAIAIGTGRDAPLASRSWEAGYRHGEELLAVLDELFGEAGMALADVAGVVVGTGPGAFTGLRVGLATAKGLAYGLHVPVVGIGSAAALAMAANRDGGSPGRGEVVVVLPAGPHDRYLARYRMQAREPGVPGPSAVPVSDPELVPGGEAIDARCAGATLVAVDLPAAHGISSSACTLGLAAQSGLGAALLAAGRDALDEGHADDVAALVPAYVTLPRGITAQTGTIEWSRDLR
jgi:tRNA threonylcarbamoyladenosine biosynthesis protein TsaB